MTEDEIIKFLEEVDLSDPIHLKSATQAFGWDGEDFLVKLRTLFPGWHIVTEGCNDYSHSLTFYLTRHHPTLKGRLGYDERMEWAKNEEVLEYFLDISIILPFYRVLRLSTSKDDDNRVVLQYSRVISDIEDRVCFALLFDELAKRGYNNASESLLEKRITNPTLELNEGKESSVFCCLFDEYEEPYESIEGAEEVLGEL